MRTSPLVDDPGTDSKPLFLPDLNDIQETKGGETFEDALEKILVELRANVSDFSFLSMSVLAAFPMLISSHVGICSSIFETCQKGGRLGL